MNPERHDAVILHVLFVTMTRWIPVPFVDTLAANYLRRKYIQKLAAAHGRQIDARALAILGNENFGCLHGCITGVLLFPLRLLFGLLFLLWRMKKAVDTASREYHRARLLDFAFAENLWAEQNATKLRASIDVVCSSASIGPIEGVFRTVFQSQGGILRSAARPFVSAFLRVRGVRRDETEIAAATENAEQLARDKISGLISPLRTALDAIPASLFAKLENEVRRQLAAKA